MSTLFEHVPFTDPFDVVRPLGRMMDAPGRTDAPQPSPADRLRELYANLDAAVAALAPVCAVSGRCCRFEEYGHTLFLSSPEVDFLLDRAGPPSRPLDDGATCPWQDSAGRCTARDARPLGCRVYFCDPAYQDQGPVLTEVYIGRLKRLVEELGLDWDYAPLHRHLRASAEAGRFPPTRAPGPV